MTVVATRTGNSIDRTPASVAAATDDDLDELQAQTIQPAIRRMPNVEIGGGPRPDAMVPTIRGVYGAGIQLLIDGARQNDLQSPGLRGPLYADPYFLRRIEVLRGAASSLYGSGGNGGVMSLATLSARDLLATGPGFGAGARIGYAGGDSSTHLNARVYGQGEMVDGLLALGKHDWDRIRQPGGTYIEPNDGGSFTGLMKLGIRPMQALRIEASHQLYRSDNLGPNNPQVGRYRRTTDTAAIPFLQPSHIDQSNSAIRAQYGELEATARPRIEATAYQSYLKAHYEPYGTNPRYNNAATANFQLTETRTDGVNLLATQVFGSHRVTIGGDLFIDRLDSRSGTTTLAVNPVNPAGERRGAGLFVQDEFGFAQHWKLIPTLRYDRYRANAATGTQAANEESRLTPKLTLAWQGVPNLTLYGSYGEGFRAPAVSELYQNSTIGTFSWFLPNAGLKPEIDRTLELGTKARRQNVFTDGDTVRVRAAIFDSQVRDLISSVTLGNIPGQTSCAVTGLGCRYQYQNVANGKRTGLELEASWDRGPWQASVGYGRVRVSNTDSGENLFSPPDKVTAQLRRKLPEQRMTLLWNTTFVAAQDYDSTLLRRRSGYAVHDLFVSWMPTGKTWRVDFGVANVLDKAYVIYQSGNAYANTYQTGRSVLLSLNGEI